MENILECTDIAKSYHGFTALEHIRLTVGPGRFVGLLGPNGSGKTTLIKLICGLLTPTEGSISVCGKPVGACTKADIAYLPDRDFLAGWMTPRAIVDYYADFFPDFRMDRARQMMDGLGIDTEKKIKTLSKGTREKLALILTMSRKAKLYILDEPIAGVDPAARDYILQTILANYGEDASVLLSTHLIADVEPVLTDIVFLQNGRIVENDTAAHLREANGKSVDALFREVFRC